MNTYSSKVCQSLEHIVAEADLIQTYHSSRYDRGDRIAYQIIGVHPAYRARAFFEIEKFVGGGFAGQVYRARLLRLEHEDEVVPELQTGKSYAIKILVPPSGFSRIFRNFIYRLAYQAPFSAQVNSAAARVGVLWQKLIRRAAKIYFGSERAVVDTYATFFDDTFNSHGEINEWVKGRTWKYEIDDRVFRRFRSGHAHSGSREYLSKKAFMAKMVRMLHEMGSPELARQYEWGTMKSQPNALLRLDSAQESADDLCCIDFRAGLALLPFLPMSPADVRLIIKGLLRGDLVQFDRGDLKRLEVFIAKHPEEFLDLKSAHEELEELEPRYRRSIPDIFHQGFRLIFSRSLRADIADGCIQAWKSLKLLDDRHAGIVHRSSLRFMLYYVAGAIPLMGHFIRKLWGSEKYARHVGQLIARRDYFKRTLKSKQAVTLIDWHRDGRANELRTLKLLDRPVRFWMQRLFLSWLPPKWHRFFAEPDYARESIRYTFTYPIRFYRDSIFREQWLIEQIDAGTAEGMLTSEEAAHLTDNIKDPFIQKYLKCVAVHVATLPITQVVSVVVAIYAMIRFGQTWAQGLALAGMVLAAFQATPISPGSLVRGTYVLYLMIKEKDMKNYWVAAMISFWHYIGYLAFPIQMVAKFPALSRLMAGRWATGIVHIIPVFGERGALLEHWIFDLFFNVPISIRRSSKK